MPVTQFVEHQGKKILIIDFASSTADEFIAEMDEAMKVIAGAEPASLLVLTDVRETVIDKRANEKLKEFTRHNTPFVKRSAVVGVSGLKKVFLSGVRLVTQRDIRAFDSHDEAKDWLATD